MKSSTNPALAVLVGTLVLGQLNGTDPNKAPLPIGAGQHQAVDAEGIAGSVTALINQLKPKAQAAVEDLLKDINQPGKTQVARTHQVASKAAIKVEEKPPLPRHIRFPMPPPAPPMSPEEKVKVQAQRDMYERIMKMNQVDREAELATSH